MLPSVVVWTDECECCRTTPIRSGSCREMRRPRSSPRSARSARSTRRFASSSPMATSSSGTALRRQRRHPAMSASHTAGGIGNYFLIDMSSTAGTATPTIGGTGMSTSPAIVQSTYLPIGTTLAHFLPGVARAATERTIGYRSAARECAHGAGAPSAARFGKCCWAWRSRARQNSPFLLDTLDPEGASKKYIGGLAVNF